MEHLVIIIGYVVGGIVGLALLAFFGITIIDGMGFRIGKPKS